MTLATIIYVILCILLVLLVLLQQSRGGLGIFGGASDTILGPTSGDFMTKATSTLAVLFIVGALVLSILSSGKKTAFDKEPSQPVQQVEQPKEQTIQKDAAEKAGDTIDIQNITNLPGQPAMKKDADAAPAKEEK